MRSYKWKACSRADMIWDILGYDIGGFVGREGGGRWPWPRNQWLGYNTKGSEILILMIRGDPDSYLSLITRYFPIFVLAWSRGLDLRMVGREGGMGVGNLSE